VRAMKEFAHPQTEQAPADLNRALTTTLTVARNEYKYVAEVQTEFDELPLVVCNLSDLNQVFLNLIVNAAHAIQDVLAPGELGTIRVGTTRDGDAVLVTIADTGGGIPHGVRTRIFDPFFTTKDVGRGSGQGLAIARAVVDKHGGTIGFHTVAGKGTTFTIRLPIAGVQITDPAQT
jgi:two-component system, NtrC family, sensor kinase